MASDAAQSLAAPSLPLASEGEGPACVIAARLSASRLHQLIAAAPEDVKGSIQALERDRTLQIQLFRILAYLSSAPIMLYFRNFTGSLFAVPALLGLANLVCYYLLRRVAWFQGLNTFLFFVDILATELLVWHNGVLTTPMVMWLPVLVIAMSFFLPPARAIALSILLSVIHAYLVVAQSRGLLPVGRIISNAGFEPAVLQAMLGNHWQRNFSLVATVLLVLGSMFFATYVFSLLRQREYELTRANELIRRYVPTQLADQILGGSYTEAAHPERKKLTIFFSDIKGFTETADQLEAEELSRVLNEYLSEMSAIALQHGGTVDKFVGDALMVLFGAPNATSDKDHASRAVCMARQMQKRMDQLREKWFHEGIQAPFQVRMGINTGLASVGNFGSQERMDYTAIGNQVNLAARLQSHAEPGRILVSHSTWALVKDEFSASPKGEIQVKGIHYPVKVYELA